MRESMEKVIPNHLLFETIRGVCNANCIMCDINTWRKIPHIQSQEEFENILSKFLPYRDKLDYLSLFWRGEPLLDKDLAGKIRWANRKGFRGIGVSTNCIKLNLQKSADLLEAGLDTVLCCIDGAKKETHEAIRVGTNFEQVVKNIQNFIKLRDVFHFSAKVVLRYICQKKNIDELEDFKRYWQDYLNQFYGDKIEVFPVVSCQGSTNLRNYKSIDCYNDVADAQSIVCKELNERMMVSSTGDVGLCCADNSSVIKIENVLNKDPIEIFNNSLFTKYREMLLAGRKSELPICKECTVPRSHQIKKKAI
jgi:MoaA/NifB/PqqE/SkfB family radical SAM enzyme